MNELIAELKSMLYKAKNPTMDNSHQINFNDLNRLLTKVIIRSEDLLKQNEELKNKLYYLITIIDDYNDHEANAQLNKIKI